MLEHIIVTIATIVIMAWSAPAIVRRRKRLANRGHHEPKLLALVERREIEEDLADRYPSGQRAPWAREVPMPEPPGFRMERTYRRPVATTMPGPGMKRSG